MIFPLLRTIVNTNPIFCYDRYCVVSDDILISGKSTSRIEGGSIMVEWNNEVAVIPYDKNPIFDGRGFSEHRMGNTTISFSVHVSQDYYPSLTSTKCQCEKCITSRETTFSPTQSIPVGSKIMGQDIFFKTAIFDKTYQVSQSLESLAIALDIGIEKPTALSEGMLAAIKTRVLECSLSS